MREVMVGLENVEKSYRQGAERVRALRGVTLSVATGEFVAVMGPSGSGKSTLLQLVGGIDVADSGRVSVDGRLLSQMPDDELTLFRRRHVGFVFQFFNLLPTLDAEENVALPLLLDGVAGAAGAQRARALLERVGLGARRRHRPDQLSGGEMQRVAIARALVMEPAVLLADEPTGSLDSRTGNEIFSILRDETRDRHQTIIMVTHDRAAASRADRVVTLEDGAVTYTEPGADVGGLRVLR
jgi:putative ABC transport system ATP-binding protein